MRVLDMFSGIGGFSLGLHRAGFRTVAFAEVDPYASRVLAARFPGVPNLGDVTKAEFPAADFITAGFPCQDISNAGQRAGITGARSGLYGHVVRAIRVVRPRGALLENVAALLNRGMGTVLGDLAEIGHDAEWHCIPASAVGAPHIRDRVWIYAEPQHPDADRIGPHRAQEHHGRPQPGNEQGRLVGSLGALLADAARELPHRSWRARRGRPEPANSSEDVADTVGIGQPRPRQSLDASDQATDREGQAGDAVHVGIGHEWRAEPNVGRVANGIPARVDRLKALGNAVVPQIPELIGRAILASLAEQKEAA